MDDFDEQHGPGIRTESIGPLPTINDLVKPLSAKDARHLSIVLGDGLDPDEDAEDLSRLFRKEIPLEMVEKHNARSRIAELLQIPKKLQNWRRKKR